MKKRYFIVSPIYESDFLWQLCETKKHGRINDIYDQDTYDVVETEVGEKAIKKLALKYGSKSPKII